MGQTFQNVLKTIIVLIGVVFVLLTVLPFNHERRVSNDSAAVANLRTINAAEYTYRDSNGGGRFGALTDLVQMQLIEDTFLGRKTGYRYSITVDATGYTASAMPASKEMGKYGYVSRSDAVVRYAEQASPECTPCFPKGKAGEIVRD